MPEIQMFLDDAQKSVLGQAPAQQSHLKLGNPFYSATEMDRAGDRKGAERVYLELLNSDFTNPVLCAALGMNYAIAEKNGLANLLLMTALHNINDMLPAFKRLGITPKSDANEGITAFLNMKRSELENAIGTTFKHENRTAEAREWFERAQAGIAPNPDIQNNLGTLYINEGLPSDAFKHLDLAISIDPHHAQAHWNRSLALLESGRYAEGWAEYDWGITGHVRVDRNYTTAAQPPLPFWKGEEGARVIVYGEQGIGDEILFASMLPDLIGKCEIVVLECHKKLHKLFANSFPALDIYPTREDEQITWPSLPDGTSRYNFTHKIALGSLGQFFRNSLADFDGLPFLTPTPAAELTWNEALAKLPPGPKIGLSWIGGHKKTRVEVRSLMLEQMLPILQAAPNAQFISLQYTPQEDEIAAFCAKHGITIHQFPEAVYSAQYDDKAGLVANLDLVVTVCTSLVHLAGSMGVPTWVLTPSRPAWRYRLDLDTMPWYKNTVLFRQAEGNTNWSPVIAEVAAQLKSLSNK